MIYIVLDVEDSALQSLTQSLQILILKDMPGENVATAVSHLKGSLMMLQNCDAIPTDTIFLLNNIKTSANCSELTEYMKMIYFALKRKKF